MRPTTGFRFGPGRLSAGKVYVGDVREFSISGENREDGPTFGSALGPGLWEQVRIELALAHARAIDETFLLFALYHWECFWCGMSYMRDRRPVVCQRCGSSLFYH